MFTPPQEDSNTNFSSHQKHSWGLGKKGMDIVAVLQEQNCNDGQFTPGQKQLSSEEI